ncbi:MAG: glycoside hydrolase family 65 protein [Clostridia bacterium]|nr:glycoside hydrolase family 65 protein [Clostridia bacterium]
MSKWKLIREGFNKDQIVTDGNRFLCANGYMGLRGVFEEADSKMFPAITLAGVYDQYQNLWREPVNAPHCLYIKVLFNGKEMMLGKEEPMHHQAGIDYGDALYQRETDYGSVLIRSERFVSMAEAHLLCDRMELSFREDGELIFISGISRDIWDINGPHLFDYKAQFGEAICIQATTGEKKTLVASAQCVAFQADTEESYEENEKGIFRILRKHVTPNERVIFDIFGTVFTSMDALQAGDAAIALCMEKMDRGYERCLQEHLAAWRRIQKESEINLEGNEEAALALKASQYHLNSIAPRHADNLSIPARGLSGQTYKGAIFWDSEIFFFPMFVHTQPEVAKSLLRYRIETLPGAIKKAAEYGYRGAFYAWESQEGGEEGCTNFNVVDVFTHRPVRTYFRDKQIHISADIAYALRSYYEITGDRSLLKEGGARVILECARFYISRASCHADHDDVDYADVIGPDEYHERVTNNAFTNRMIRYCMESALLIETIFSDQPDWFAALMKEAGFDKDWRLLREICKRIKEPNIKNNIIEQFDGYFDLEDCSLDTVRGRLCHPREYWGGDHGVAGTTQIIKQADVIAMMALFPDDFSDKVVADNWYYYEPRTEHGSSLSACMYALTACRLGLLDKAWDLFMRTASIDVIGGGKEWAGEIYIGGTHPASNGGAWMIAALGFAGLNIKNGQPAICPHLPEQITKLSFPIIAGGKRLRVTVTHDGGVIDSDF